MFVCLFVIIILYIVSSFCCCFLLFFLPLLVTLTLYPLPSSINSLSLLSSINHFSLSSCINPLFPPPTLTLSLLSPLTLYPILTLSLLTPPLTLFPLSPGSFQSYTMTPLIDGDQELMRLNVDNLSCYVRNMRNKDIVCQVFRRVL